MQTSTEVIAQEIIRCFRRGLLAAESLEGIARWRLTQQMVERTVDETFAALQLLIERGFVEKVPTTGSDPLFRLNVDKYAEIEEFLRFSARSEER